MSSNSTYLIICSLEFHFKIFNFVHETFRTYTIRTSTCTFRICTFRTCTFRTCTCTFRTCTYKDVYVGVQFALTCTFLDDILQYVYISYDFIFWFGITCTFSVPHVFVPHVFVPQICTL